MMKLDEAIKHAEEVADTCEYEASKYDMSDSYESHVAYQEGKCAEEHRQLAEWLKELKRVREQTRWISCSDMLPKENICDDGYVEPSDYVLVFGDQGDYGVSRYWGNRISKKENPNSFSDWMDLDWYVEKPIAWMPLPEPYKKEGEAE